MAEPAKRYFQEQLSNLNYTVKHYGEPSPTKMTRFVAGLEKNTRTRLGGAPGDVKGHIVGQFATVNWDFRGKKLADGQGPPESVAVVGMLQGLVEYLNSYAPAAPAADAGGEAKGDDAPKSMASVLAAAAAAPAAPEPAACPDPTAEQIADLSLAIDQMFLIDPNHLHPDVDYELDFQRQLRPYQEGDVAPGPLFRRINLGEILKRPSYALFYKLLDNYEREGGKAEVVTSTERREESAFLNHALATPPMQFLHKILVAKKKVGSSKGAMKALLHDIWFELYARKGRVKDSSGFEHVFIGEEKQGAVTGMHNWLQLYNEERAGRLNFCGHYKPKRRGGGGTMERYEKERVGTIKLSWCGDDKPKSTTLFGVSPEFEMAMYTLCFLCGEDQNDVKLGPYQLRVKCYKWNSRGKTYVATSYPEEQPFSQGEAASKIQSQFRARRGRREYSSRRR